MKILLVNPVSKVWTSPELIHLGLAYIAGTLEQRGHEVRIFDAPAESQSYETVLKQGWDVVGVTATTPQIFEAFETIDIAKKYTNALIMMGGPHPTLDPMGMVERDNIDLVIRGEAEAPLNELFEVLEKRDGRPLSDFRIELEAIHGLTIKLETGEIVHVQDRKFRKDLSDLPKPAYHLFNVDKYSNLQPMTDGFKKERSFTIMTSRGCPHACIFCSRGVEGRTWRPRAIPEVIEEWRWLTEECGATEIGIADDVWNLHLGRAKDLCRALIDAGLTKVPWVTIHGMRADASDLELFQLMKQAGCRRVGFGVESGNQKVLDIIKKKQSVEQIRVAMANAKAAGLQTMGFFIFGMPGENEQTMEDTIQFAIELDPDLANFMIAAPYPGTELYDLVQKEGSFTFKDWSEIAIHSDKAHFSIGEVRPEVVERKWREAYRRFYMRPRRLYRRLTSMDTYRNLPRYFATAKRFFIERRPDMAQSA